MLFSCEDILDQKNPNRMDTTHFWLTEDDLVSGLNACYRAPRFDGEYRRWLPYMYISRADEGYTNNTGSAYNAYSKFLTPNLESGPVIFPWLDLHKGVFWANQVLDNAPKIEIDDEKRNLIIGQALFLRGLGFFNIAGVYGRGVILLTAEATATPKICEQDELYRQARSDFYEASKLLPAVWEKTEDIGRITKGAALGMDIKTSAQLSKYNPDEWDRVITRCEEIVALKTAGGQPLYTLVANYADNFKSATENNSESLFEIQFMDGTSVAVEQVSHMRQKFFGFAVNSIAWQDEYPRPIVRTDLSKEKTLAGKPDPRLKETLFYYDASNPNELIYGKTWTGWGLSTTDASITYWKKYTHWDTQTTESADYKDGDINLRIVRLADIYLMYAEALNERDRTAEAYEWIDKVRERAGLSKLENSTVFTNIGNDKTKMRQQIMHERMCELASEGWRWLDLDRWGMFDTPENISYLKSRDSDFDNFEIGKHNRFPIPSKDIGLMPGLKQNPKY
jgi:hypothetical protein